MLIGGSKSQHWAQQLAACEKDPFWAGTIYILDRMQGHQPRPDASATRAENLEAAMGKNQLSVLQRQVMRVPGQKQAGGGECGWGKRKRRKRGRRNAEAWYG